MPQSLLSIFVVDDEPLIAMTLGLILKGAGFPAISFTDPIEALNAARQTIPELLISDVMMPGMTGIELAIQFRELYPSCRILLFSGQWQTADLLSKAQEQGHEFEILAKPVHPKDLLAKLGAA